ncbi:hypothetical protein XENOCAPTIV_023282 [Xenoophorus captivus]|uniref:Uncharacterized protein n=1 Tax=Xenoophorus captivus TaxID=1517983 RepID=A0ABV0QJU0_9TELE
MGEPQQQRKPGPHQPKQGYQQKLVPILEKTSGVSGRSGGMGERHKEGFGPTHAPMRCSPKDWHCPSGRTRGDSELRPWSQTGPPLPCRWSPKCDPPPLGEAAITPEGAPAKIESQAHTCPSSNRLLPRSRGLGCAF